MLTSFSFCVIRLSWFSFYFSGWPFVLTFRLILPFLIIILFLPGDLIQTIASVTPKCRWLSYFYVWALSWILDLHIHLPTWHLHWGVPEAPQTPNFQNGSWFPPPVLFQDSLSEGMIRSSSSYKSHKSEYHPWPSPTLSPKISTQNDDQHQAGAQQIVTEWLDTCLIHPQVMMLLSPKYYTPPFSLLVALGLHCSAGTSARCYEQGLLLLQSMSSRVVGSGVVAHRLSCSTVYGIFQDQGSNPCPLHWQADS